MLYKEATLIADDYLPSYFSDESSSWAVQSQLAAMRLYLDSSLWFVEKNGTMITLKTVNLFGKFITSTLLSNHILLLR